MAHAEARGVTNTTQNPQISQYLVIYDQFWHLHFSRKWPVSINITSFWWILIQFSDGDPDGSWQHFWWEHAECEVTQALCLKLVFLCKIWVGEPLLRPPASCLQVIISNKACNEVLKWWQTSCIEQSPPFQPLSRFCFSRHPHTENVSWPRGRESNKLSIYSMHSEVVDLDVTVNITKKQCEIHQSIQHYCMLVCIICVTRTECFSMKCPDWMLMDVVHINSNNFYHVTHLLASGPYYSHWYYKVIWNFVCKRKRRVAHYLTRLTEIYKLWLSGKTECD